MIPIKSIAAILVMAIALTGLTMLSQSETAAENAMRAMKEAALAISPQWVAEWDAGADAPGNRWVDTGTPSTVVIENEVNVSVALNMPNGTVVDLGSTPRADPVARPPAPEVETAGTLREYGVYLYGLRRVLIDLTGEMFDRRPNRSGQTGRGN